MGEVIRVRNWDRWQSYRKDRGQPPWIKLHRCIMRNPEWVSLTDAQRGQLVAMWLLAADHDGVIPASPRIIQKLCHLDSEPDLQLFVSLGFLDGCGQIDANVTSTRRQHDAPETETDTETEKKKTGARAPRPSVQEVAEYIRDRGSNVDAQRFVDFYTSNGWKVGKNPMKDWKAAVRTWEKRDEKPNGAFGKPVRIEDKLAHLRRLSGEETGGESLDPPRGDVRGAVLEGVFRRAE